MGSATLMVFAHHHKSRLALPKSSCVGLAAIWNLPACKASHRVRSLHANLVGTLDGHIFNLVAAIGSWPGFPSPPSLSAAGARQVKLPHGHHGRQTFLNGAIGLFFVLLLRLCKLTTHCPFLDRERAGLHLFVCSTLGTTRDSELSDGNAAPPRLLDRTGAPFQSHNSPGGTPGYELAPRNSKVLLHP
jgi:hypothetical protein